VDLVQVDDVGAEAREALLAREHDLLRGERLRGHRVHLGRIHEVHAAFQREVELVVGLGFAVLAAEGHRAEGGDRDGGPAAAERIRFHGKRRREAIRGARPSAASGR